MTGRTQVRAELVATDRCLRRSPGSLTDNALDIAGMTPVPQGRGAFCQRDGATARTHENGRSTAPTCGPVSIAAARTGWESAAIEHRSTERLSHRVNGRVAIGRHGLCTAHVGGEVSFAPAPGRAHAPVRQAVATNQRRAHAFASRYRPASHSAARS